MEISSSSIKAIRKLKGCVSWEKITVNGSTNWGLKSCETGRAQKINGRTCCIKIIGKKYTIFKAR